MDADHDGVVTKNEMNKAMAALRKVHKDKQGNMTMPDKAATDPKRQLAPMPVSLKAQMELAPAVSMVATTTKRWAGSCKWTPMATASFRRTKCRSNSKRRYGPPIRIATASSMRRRCKSFSRKMGDADEGFFCGRKSEQVGGGTGRRAEAVATTLRCGDSSHLSISVSQSAAFDLLEFCRVGVALCRPHKRTLDLIEGVLPCPHR